MQLEKLNHFEKFNLKTQFQINLEQLEEQYLSLQKKFHPDSAKNQTDAQINSALINQSYKILKKPLSRAIYLLKLQNINVEDEECSVKPSMEVLTFVMNLREEILENPQNKNHIKERIKKIIEEEMSQVANLLSQKKYQEAAQLLIKVKYLDKIIFDLKK
jgi:molecular chaperone HscB